MRQNFSSESFCVKGFLQYRVSFCCLLALALIVYVILLPAEVKADRQDRERAGSPFLSAAACK